MIWTASRCALARKALYRNCAGKCWLDEGLGGQVQELSKASLIMKYAVCHQLRLGQRGALVCKIGTLRLFCCNILGTNASGSYTQHWSRCTAPRIQIQ